ncbi:MAG: PAS domain S-box protein [Bacteroidota bacterium]
MKNLSATISRIMDKKIRWILAFSLIAFILFLLVLIEQKKKQESSRSLVDHTNQVIKKIDTIGLVFAEAEAAARSYLVVHSPDWKKQTYLLQALVNRSLASFQQLTADNPVQQQNAVALQKLCSQKEVFQVRLLNGSVSGQELMQMISPDGEGPVISRAVKHLERSIRDIEEKILVSRMAENEASYQTSIYTAFGGGVFALLLVLAILSQLNQDINLRKKAEEGVVASEEKYRNLIENAGSVMYTADTTGAINFANNRVAELTEYTVGELNGKNFSFLIDTGWRDKVVQFYVNQFASKTVTTNLEFLITTKSGKQKWVEQAAQLLFNDNGRITGFQCMVTDITERKTVETELNESETRRKENEYRLNAIMDNSTALIYIKDTEGHYLMANKRFKDFFGLSDELVVGQTDYDFNPKELADYFKETDARVLTTLRPIETEELIETPWGSRNLLLLKFPLITPDGVLLGVSGIASDVTDKTEMQKQTIAALKKVETAQQIQEQFLANMSHEIRTPMNGIQGMTRLLLETKLSDEQKRFTNIISRSLNNLVVIVNNVLDFSNLKAGKLVLDTIVFDLPEILEELKKYFDHQLQNKQLGFQLIIHKDVPRLVKGDSFRLKQVLTNLVGNSIKFTNEGEIALQVSTGVANKGLIPIVFRLSDTGIGIPKDKLETIFESFAQAGKKISSGYGGAGLGLTISKGLIEMQGGSITVQSTQGSGSVFTFSIPFEQAEKQDATSSSQNDYVSLLSGKRILVVEDNIVNQRLIDFVLKKVHITADLANNGKEAIDLCEKNPPYDLIIMDLQMPVMDGYETTVYMRQQMALTTPIIAMTATALREDQERSAAVGMDDFMIKPFDFNDLYNRLIRLLYRIEVNEEEDLKEKEEKEALFNLSLLAEIGDAGDMLEVLDLFLENAAADVKKLEQLAHENNQHELYRLAHKLKSAVATIQAKKLTELCRAIELNAKNEENIPQTLEMVKEVVSTFASIEQPLRDEMERIRKEARTNS